MKIEATSYKSTKQCLMIQIISRGWQLVADFFYLFFNIGKIKIVLSCQPRVTVTSCFVTMLSIDHLCINPILRIGLIQK